MNFPATLEQPLSDLEATLERPGSDLGDLGATSRTAAAAASATNVDKILQKVGFCVDFGRFWVDIGHPADWLFLDWDGPRSPGIPMEPDSQLNSMIGIMASKRWGYSTPLPPPPPSPSLQVGTQLHDQSRPNSTRSRL